jgi:hypothetical protein
VSRARATTIPKPQQLKQLKQLTLPLASKVRQAPSADSGPMAGPTKKPPQINPHTRPATATGRVASTSLTKPTPAPRTIVRPASSASLRPQTTTARPAKFQTKLQTGATPLATDQELHFEFEGIDVRGDDFMFDV